MESLTEFRSSVVGTDKFPELLFLGFHIENSGEAESGPKGGDDRGLTSPAATDMLARILHRRNEMLCNIYHHRSKP